MFIFFFSGFSRPRSVIGKFPWLFRVGMALFLLLLFFPRISSASTPESPPTLDSLLKMSLEELVEVEITAATGSPKPVRTAPAVASVITAADIEAMGATSLDEALETVPGLHVYPAQAGHIPCYSIRGIQTFLDPQTLVLVNGLPISSPYNGRPIAGLRIGVADISRIEVVRGPGSAVHGADAFAGTINVITKDGQELNGVASGLRGGSFGTYDAWTQYGKNQNGWDTALSLEYQQSDGDSSRIVPHDTQTVLDAAFNTKASLAPGKLPTDYQNVDGHLSLRKDNWTFRLWGSMSDDALLGGGATLVLDDQGEADYRLLLSDLTYENNHLINNWDMRLRFSYLYQHSDVRYYAFPPGALLTLDQDGNLTDAPAAIRYLGLFTDGYIGEPIQTDHIPAIDFESFYHGVTHHLLRFGAGYRIQDEDTETYLNFGREANDLSTFAPFPAVNVIGGNLTYVNNGPSTYLPDQQRRIWNVSLQDEWSLARRWELTAGVRYDHYSDFGGTTNPRVALVWETWPELTSKVLYGRAFRPPSFAEGHNQNNPSILGNPNLEPETIDTYELAFDYQPAATFRSQLNFFYYDIEGLIDYVADANGTTKTAQNVKDQEGRGLELVGIWKITNTLELRANLALQRSEDKDSGELIADAPARQFYVNAHWQFLPKWSLDGQYFWIGDRHRAQGDPRPAIKDNDIVNLTLRRKDIARHWDLALAVRNLFNEDVREPAPYVNNSNIPERSYMPEDFPMEGRSLWAELRYAF